MTTYLDRSVECVQDEEVEEEENSGDDGGIPYL